jgi:hypothetical protein
MQWLWACLVSPGGRNRVAVTAVAMLYCLGGRQAAGIGEVSVRPRREVSETSSRSVVVGARYDQRVRSGSCGRASVRCDVTRRRARACGLVSVRCDRAAAAQRGERLGEPLR